MVWNLQELVRLAKRTNNPRAWVKTFFFDIFYEHQKTCANCRASNRGGCAIGVEIFQKETEALDML